jgi:hypothetical protein
MLQSSLHKQHHLTQYTFHPFKMTRNKGKQRAAFAPNDDFDNLFLHTPRPSIADMHCVPETAYYQHLQSSCPTHRANNFDAGVAYWSASPYTGWSLPQYTSWVPPQYTSWSPPQYHGPQFTHYIPPQINDLSYHPENSGGVNYLPRLARQSRDVAGPSRSTWNEYIQTTPRDDYCHESRTYQNGDYAEEMFARYAQDHGRDERTEQPQPTFSRYYREAGPSDQAAGLSVRSYQASVTDEGDEPEHEIDFEERCRCSLHASIFRLDDEIADLRAEMDLLVGLVQWAIYGDEHAGNHGVGY